MHAEKTHFTAGRDKSIHKSELGATLDKENVLNDEVRTAVRMFYRVKTPSKQMLLHLCTHRHHQALFDLPCVLSNAIHSQSKARIDAPQFGKRLGGLKTVGEKTAALESRSHAPETEDLFQKQATHELGDQLDEDEPPQCAQQ